MSAEQQTNQTAAEQTLLDALTSEVLSDQAGRQLFDLADLLDQEKSLLRALTDPGRSSADRQALARNLLQDRAVTPVVNALVQLAGQHWSRPDTFRKTVEDLGVRAILHGAKFAGELSRVEDELFALNQLASLERELRIRLSDVGGTNDEERQAITDRLLAGKVADPTLALVKRAVHISGRGRLLQTLRHFAERAAQAHNAQLVTVATATELTDAQLARLRDLIKTQVGGDVSLAVSVEPNLIGGFRINYGDEAADSSIRSELGAARRALTR